MTNAEGRAYFKAHGWPTKLDGTLKPINDLDKGELILIARLYAGTLHTELGQVTVPSVRPQR